MVPADAGETDPAIHKRTVRAAPARYKEDLNCFIVFGFCMLLRIMFGVLITARGNPIAATLHVAPRSVSGDSESRIAEMAENGRRKSRKIYAKITRERDFPPMRRGS